MITHTSPLSSPRYARNYNKLQTPPSNVRPKKVDRKANCPEVCALVTCSSNCCQHMCVGQQLLESYHQCTPLHTVGSYGQPNWDTKCLHCGAVFVVTIVSNITRVREWICVCDHEHLAPTSSINSTDASRSPAIKSVCAEKPPRLSILI